MMRYISALLVILPFSCSIAQTGLSTTQLPTLAPVLKNIMPAIVNVAVQGINPGVAPSQDDDDGQEKSQHATPAQPPKKFQSIGSGVIIGGGKIDTFYGRHPRNRLKMAVCKQGKQAITNYTVKHHYQFVTLLDVALMTGRTHQIRVHLAHLNHPVVGDPLYGGRPRTPASLTEPLRQALQQFPRQALHAHSLILNHPISEKELTFTAPLPDDFQKLLGSIDNWGHELKTKLI